MGIMRCNASDRAMPPLLSARAAPFFVTSLWHFLGPLLWPMARKRPLAWVVVCRTLVLLAALPAAAQVSFSPLAVQPPDNIYGLVTAPAAGRIYACNGTRVLYSTDEGVSWQATANNGASGVACLYVSASGQLYAGAEKASAAGVTAGVFKYNSALNTWAPMTGSPLTVTALFEDPGTGILYAGTGTSGNIAPNPITLGTGVYAFNGTTWSAASTGISNLPGFAVKPFIKAFARLTTGELLAATYGGGVLKYTAGTWSTYGTGLGNQYTNCLAFDAAGLLYAGTDGGVYVSSGSTWTVAAPGLPAGKPVRALMPQGTTLWAGLGYYPYQKGSVKGELFSLTLPGAGPWASAGSGFNSTSVLRLAATPAHLFAGACGVWALPVGGNTWVYSLNGFSLPNRTAQMVHNTQGHLFAMCASPPAAGGFTTFGYGGVFRSTDGGASWQSINQGVSCLGLTAIFVDSQDYLWLGGRQFTGLSTNPAWGNPELYKSVDNGTTWVQNTSISLCHDGYQFFAETAGGRMYVTDSFFSPTTNISATNDYATFDNTLTGNQSFNYGKPYGLGVNANGDVFMGTETNGIMRSTANGAPGTFTSITINAPTAPTGNNSVYVDPYNGNLFGAGTHGKVNGVGNWPKDNFCSLGPDNGLNMFPFNNLADFSSFGAMTSDNRGNFYAFLNAGTFTVSGLYVAAPPFTSNTVFTRLTIAPASVVSYQFNAFMTDACGYLYGLNITGAGVYRSALPVNTPATSALTAPVANATNVSLVPAFSWVGTACASTTYQLQVATDAAFTNVIADQAALAAPTFQLAGGVVTAGNPYFWRVRTTNAAGSSPWSAARAFTTLSPLPVTLVSFRATPNRQRSRIDLTWQTTGIADGPTFDIERSPDGLHFARLTTVPARVQGGPNTYTALDEHPTPGTGYYRLAWPTAHGQHAYSVIVAVNFDQPATCVTVSTITTDNRLAVQAPCAHPAYRVSLVSLLGATVMQAELLPQQDAALLNTAPLPGGIYVLRVHDAGGQLVTHEKVLVE